MEVDNDNDKREQYLVEFNSGNYKNCRFILEEIFAEQRLGNVENRTLNDCILQNNIIVCKCLENLVADTTSNFADLKFSLKRELGKVATISTLNVDVTLAIVFNLLSLFWFGNNHSANNEASRQLDFEEQLHLALPSLCRVLGGSGTNVKLEQIKVAFTLSDRSLELLDSRQAFLVNVIRVLIAVAAQDDFVLKISLHGKETLSLPHANLCSDKHRDLSQPILLLPVLYGAPMSLRNLNVQEATGNLNLVFAALLARLKKYKSALLCLSQNYESLELRALAIYLRAYVHSQSNMRLEAQKLLEGLFSMRVGREGELGCRARILQSRLVSVTGKHQQAVNILRQATKNHGSKWILLDALASTYAQHNQDETVVRTLELALQCLLCEEQSLPTFQCRVLHCLHRDVKPSVSKTLYQLANLHCKLKNYSAAGEKMLQLLARQEDISLRDVTLPWLRTLLRESSLLMYQAGRLDEATLVCVRAASCNITSPSQIDKNAKWLDELSRDVIALLMLGRIHIAARKWTDALAALDSCVCALRQHTPTPGTQQELHSRLLTTSLLATTQVYRHNNDVPNTKHAFHKALQANKIDRETLLLFVQYLLERGDEVEAHKVWFSGEKLSKKLDFYQSSDQVLTFLLAPSLSELQSQDIEKLIKISIINARK